MGDVRFDAAREHFEEARRKGHLDRVSPETGVQALAAIAAEADAFGANVLATRLLNQLRRSASLLRFVSDGVVALDAQGAITFANPAAERLLGWDEGALVGRDLHETVHHRHSDGREVARRECALLSALDESSTEAVRVHDHDMFTRKDGSTFLVGFAAAPILHRHECTGLAIAFRDITEEKEREARLALHAVALDAVPEPVFWLDRDARVLYVNRAACDHLGYAREELETMRVFDFDPDFPPERWEENWKRIEQGGIATIDSHHRTREGDVVPVRIKVQLVRHGANAFHVAVIRRTERAD